MALQGPDDREALLNACAASQCGWRCPNKVTVSGSCLCYSLWLRSRAHTQFDAGQVAPLGLQGTWGYKGGADGLTRGFRRTVPGRAGQLGRGPCSGERRQLGRALSVALGLTGPSGCTASPSHGMTLLPPRCGLRGISEAARQELETGSFLDVPGCVRSEREVGGWTAGGPGPGPGLTLPSREPHHQERPVREPALTSPPVPACRACPWHTPAARRGRWGHCSNTRSPAFYSYEDLKNTRHLRMPCGLRRSRPSH